jgi:hypothetical protein
MSTMHVATLIGRDRQERAEQLVATVEAAQER